MTRQSPLDTQHRQLGAKLTPFGGWQMPLQYPSGVIAEHRSVRDGAGLFDVSHLGKLLINGSGARDALEKTLPRSLSKLKVGAAAYNLVLNSSGGIVDDIFVYRREEDFMLVPNASNTDAVLSAVSERAEGVQVEDARERWAILALSGNRVRGLLEEKLPEATGLRLHRFIESSFDEIPVTLARTGYTGEFTIEFFVDWDKAPELWERLMDLGGGAVKPAGLGARDTLRLEMGYPLHGHEISEETNPVEAGLGWLIDWTKDFVGKDAIETYREQQPARVLVGLVAHGREIPRSGYPIMQGDEAVGEVTSGNFSPTLGKGIALGYVPVALADPGTMLSVMVRTKALDVEVTRPPFVKRT